MWCMSTSCWWEVSFITFLCFLYFCILYLFVILYFYTFLNFVFLVMHVYKSLTRSIFSYFRIFPFSLSCKQETLLMPLKAKVPQNNHRSLHLINPNFSFRNPPQSRSRDPIFCDTKIERAGGREVVSRSRSARHKRTPKTDQPAGPSKSRLNKETRSGTAKNYDYESHLSENTRSGTVAKNYDYEAHLSSSASSKNFDAAESHFLKKTTADEQSGTAPDSNSRQGHIHSFFNDMMMKVLNADKPDGLMLKCCKKKGRQKTGRWWGNTNSVGDAHLLLLGDPLNFVSLTFSGRKEQCLVSCSTFSSHFATKKCMF